MNGKTTGSGATSREAPLPRATPCLFPEPRAFEPLKSSYARQADGDSPSPGGEGRGEGEMTAPASARVPSVQWVPSMGFSFQGILSPFASCPPMNLETQAPLASLPATKPADPSPSPGGAGRGEGEITAPASARVPSVQSVPSMGFSFQGKFSPFAYFAVKNAFFSFLFSPFPNFISPSTIPISTFNFHLSPFVL